MKIKWKIIVFFSIFLILGISAWVIKAKVDYFFTYNLPPEVIFEDRTLQRFAKAIADGDLERVKKMADRGVDVNAKGKFGLTPLYFAIHYDRFAVYQYLLQQGADPNQKFEENRGRASKYNLIAISIFTAAVNDRNPDYLAESIKYGGKLPNNDFWLMFGYFSPGYYRPGYLHTERLTGEEIAKIDREKLEIAFQAGYTVPEDEEIAAGRLAGAFFGDWRYAAVSTMLQKGFPISARFLDQIWEHQKQLEAAKKKNPYLDELCDILRQVDPDIFSEVQRIKEQYPLRDIYGKPIPGKSEQFNALKELVAQWNLKRHAHFLNTAEK